MSLAQQHSQNWVDVVFPLARLPMFSYHFDQDDQYPTIGSRVMAPVGTKNHMGFVVAYPKEVLVQTKPIGKILDPTPVLTQEQVELLLWCEKKYACLAGEVLQTMILKGLCEKLKKRIFVVAQQGKPLTDVELNLFTQLQKKKNWDYQYFAKNQKDDLPVLKALQKKGWVEIATTFAKQKPIILKQKLFRYVQAPEKKMGSKQTEVFNWIQQKNQWVYKSQIQDQFPATTVTPILKKLITQGLLETKEEISKTHIDSLAQSDQKLVLTPDQENVLKSISDKIDLNQTAELLLHGVTGSGKTEIYLQATQYCLDKGKKVLALVPEISLTPQFVNRFIHRFGDQVALLHSQRSDSERLTEWHRILEGEANVVIGTRSAIFAPLENIGLIIMDEFHDHSYKQQDGIRYHAKDVAKQRAVFNQCVLLYGSATPDIETFYEMPKEDVLVLKDRVTGFDLPDVTVCDVKNDPHFGKKGWISQPLQQEIEKTLMDQKQALLFLNRRGYSHIVYCYRCGKEVHCPHCSVTMTFHKIKQQAQCHYCFYEHSIEWPCPSCKEGKLVHFGTGTQKLEEELGFLFPDTSIARLDRDQTTKKNVFSQTMKQMLQGKIDILIGTQMITKGLDLPNIGLVGILLADQSLYFPDFRSSEITFNLITQVVGRSGRGNYKGKAFIQTLQPEHDAIAFGARQDYQGFYDKEIQARKALGFPPFASLVLFEAVGTDVKSLEQMMKWFKEQIEKQDNQANIDILGPAPAPISKVRDSYRYHLLLKSENRDLLHYFSGWLYRSSRMVFEKRKLKLKLDLHPLNFL